MLNGYVARWRDEAYEASPVVDNEQLFVRLYAPHDAEGFTKVSDQRYVRVVPAGEITALSYVRAVCEWKAEPFIVLARNGSDKLLVEYAGSSTRAAETLGIDQVEHRVYRGWIPAGEVDRIDAVDVVLL
jgi:hypothetical protein